MEVRVTDESGRAVAVADMALAALNGQPPPP